MPIGWRTSPQPMPFARSFIWRGYGVDPVLRSAGRPMLASVGIRKGSSGARRQCVNSVYQTLGKGFGCPCLGYGGAISLPRALNISQLRYIVR